MHEHARDPEAFRRDLIAFIASLVRVRRKSRSAEIEIGDRTPLFDTGLVDSLGILELLAYLEETTGRSIPTQAVDVRHFGTVERICRRFGPDSGART